MAATSRELVWQTLDFANPARTPRELWTLPIAKLHYAVELQAIVDEFPPDIITASGYEREQAPTVGDPYAIGTYTNEWGCTFVNIQAGVIGEVKTPLIQDWAFETRRCPHPPRMADHRCRSGQPRLRRHREVRFGRLLSATVRATPVSARYGQSLHGSDRSTACHGRVHARTSHFLL